MTILVSKFWFSLLMVGLFASLTFSATTTKPTVKPSVKPSIKPTTIPTMRPSTRVPSRVPSARPSSRKPSIRPSVRPTRLPSIQPSSSPSSKPTSRPTFRPSALPTSRPSSKPSSVPSSKPSSRPSSRPTSKPSYGPKSNSAGSRSKIAPGAVAGIVIAVFVVVAFALYMARNHYNYIQRFINISGLNNAYGYLSESTHQMFKTDGHRRAATAESELAEGETAGAVHNGQFDAVDNPIWSAEESPTKGAFGFHDDDLEGNRERQGSSPSLSGRKGFGHHEDDSERMESVNLTGVAKSGYLMKRSTHKSWLRRWFFIKEGKMYYTHKAVDGTPNGSKNISAVPVANLLISTVRNASNKEFQIISPGQRGIGVGGGVYELMGENDEDAADWVRVIRLQIEGSLTKNLPSAGDSPHLSDAQSSSALMVPVAAVLNTLYAANPACVDCGARNPNWASLNLCVMMCIECSGIHRSLGSHISKVRSVTLDKWSSNAIQLLTAIGNQNANRIWESSLSDRNVKRQLIGPTADREARELFITRKYVKRAYMDADRVGGHDAATNVNDLLRASAAGDLLAVMRQLAAGTDVNATVVVAHSSDVVSNNRKTPLILACENNQVLCVELLCQWGASAEVRDGSGLSAFDVARQLRNQDILDIFAAASGDSRDRSGSGRKASR